MMAEKPSKIAHTMRSPLRMVMKPRISVFIISQYTDFGGRRFSLFLIFCDCKIGTVNSVDEVSMGQRYFVSLFGRKALWPSEDRLEFESFSAL